MIARLNRLFVWTVGLLLGTTAALKLASLGSDAGFMKMTDPILYFFTERQLMGIAGVTEVFLVGYLVWGKSQNARLFLVGWFGLVCLTYRMTIWSTGVNLNCSCLGNVYEWIKVDRKAIEKGLIGVLVYMLAGSLSLLFLRMRQAKQATAETPSKV